MKRFTTCLCLVAVLCFSSLALAQTDTLTILHINDTHSHLLPYGPKDSDGNWTWGGMARLATLIGMNRMTEPNVMLLHGGDLCVGDFMFQKYLGIAELEIMKALQYDALTLGNHEFDLYPSTLEYMLNEAGFPAEGFPVLCANLDISGEPALGNFIRPYTIKNYGNVRVGIVGLLTDLTNQISNPSPVVVLPPLSVAQFWVDSLRNDYDCDLVIVLSHMGIEYDMAAAASISGIDIIVGGHTHALITEPLQIGSTLIVQAEDFVKYLGKLKLYLNDGQLQGWDYDLTLIDETIPEEPNLAAMVAGLAAGVEADPLYGPVYTDIVANATVDLEKPLGTGLIKDNSLGDLVSDAFRQFTGTDIAMYPQGFISQTIYAGPVKGSDIFQALPYGLGLGFKLVTFETDGMSIMAGLEFAVYNMPYVEDFFLQWSNISFAYNLLAEPGSRVDYASILVNGEPINPFGAYTVTTVDGVVPFFSQIPGFQVSNLVITDDFIYTVVKDYMAANTPVTYYADGRILDLALLADPVIGTQALSDVVAQFGVNGSITRPHETLKLQSKLGLVVKHLERGQYLEAAEGIAQFERKVEVLNHLGIISDFSKGRLIYLADNLLESVPGIAAKPINGGDNQNSLPTEYQLSQNFPNPFNPETEIAYSIPVPADVNLTIYDLRGDVVRILVNGYQPAGENSIKWDGRNTSGESVSSGIYFYTLKAGDFVQTRKMSLIK